MAQQAPPVSAKIVPPATMYSNEAPKFNSIENMSDWANEAIARLNKPAINAKMEYTITKMKLVT